MRIIVRETIEHIVEIADRDVLEYFDTDNLDAAVELFPAAGNETDGFGWMLREVIDATGKGERLAALVDAHIEIEPADSYSVRVATPIKVGP